MGATVIAVAVGAAVIGAAGLAITGIYYGVKCVVHIIKEKFVTRVETSGKGNDMAKVAEGLNKDLNSHNIKRTEKDEKDLQNMIDKIKNDTNHEYKISTKIERVDGSYVHTPEEKDSLNEINVKFHKFYTHQTKIIDLCDYGNEFGDDYLNKFSLVGWENIIELNLRNNDISEIEPLYKMHLLNLEKLDLSNNNISDIDEIENLQILKLKILNLENNKITDPYAFYHSKFYTLESLNLSNNKIDDDDKEKFEKKFKSKNKNDNFNLLL